MNPDTTAQTVIRTGRTAARLFERLIRHILHGDFKGGDVIRESRLAKEWDVSRTPMREAVRRAAEAGFIVLRPNQAPVVRKLSGRDIDAMYDLRALLETHALDLAWDRIDAAAVDCLAQQAAEAVPGVSPRWYARFASFDKALHRLWVSRCGNEWLQADLKRQHLFWAIFQNWIGPDAQIQQKAYDEHMAILDAMRAEDRPRAIEALRNHIRTSAAAVRRNLEARMQNEAAGRRKRRRRRDRSTPGAGTTKQATTSTR